MESVWKAIRRAIQAVPQQDPLVAARCNFANYVQAVAFQVTLSRGMISMLGYVRDLLPHPGNLNDVPATGLPPRVDSHFVPYVERLIKRGLVWHDHPQLPVGQFHPIKGHRYYRLTRAGELMCELLVEAGLLAPQKRQRRTKDVPR